MDTKKLTPEEYWEWRCSINDINLEEQKMEVFVQKLELMAKDIEIQRLRYLLMKENKRQFEEKVEATKKEYNNYKKKLEEKYELSLEDCVINEVFEIVKL